MNLVPASAQSTSALRVQLWTPAEGWVDVGTLVNSAERTQFTTLQSYWELSDRPVLGQMFEGAAGQAFSAQVALPNWFSHLLPEGRLREALAFDAGVKTEREFFLLERIGGDDLPGALRVLPAETQELSDSTDESVPVATEGEMNTIKFSLAGVQLKFSVSESDRGLTIPASGKAGSWIAKLPDPRAGHELVPEAELASLELARALGANVPEARLIDVGEIARLPQWASELGGNALLIQRFDRLPQGGRVHVEELAQVLEVPVGPRGKYLNANFETIGRTVGALCGPQAVAEVIDRLVLNVLIGNGDAHAKNWAVVYPDGRTADLSPLYDVVPTVLFVPGDDLGMKLNGSRAFEVVNSNSFDRLAEVSGMTHAESRARARSAVERVVASWGVLDDYLPREVVERLTKRRDQLPLLTV